MHLYKIANRTEHNILRHNGRGLGEHHSNTKIDATRTHLNYCLTEQDGRTANQRFRERLAECTYRKQRNNVRLESIVLTAPKNLKQEDMQRFFKTAHKALQKLTGGQRNEITAWVHLDETTPHMHYGFVPAVEVGGVLKLSAKTLMNRHKLQVLHTEVQKIVDAEFGHHNYILVADDPAERGKGKATLQDFKAKKELEEEIGKLRESAARAEAEQALATASVAEMGVAKSKLQAENTALVKRNRELAGQIASKKDVLEMLGKELADKAAKSKILANLETEIQQAEAKLFATKQDTALAAERLKSATDTVAKLEADCKLLQEQKDILAGDADQLEYIQYVYGVVLSEYPDYLEGIKESYRADFQVEKDFDIDIEF